MEDCRGAEDEGEEEEGAEDEGEETAFEAEMTLAEEIAGKGWKRNFAPKDEWRKFCVTSSRSSPRPRDEYT